MTWNTDSMEGAAKSSTKTKAMSNDLGDDARRPRSFAVRQRRSRPVRQYTIRKHRESHYRTRSLRRPTRDSSAVELQVCVSEKAHKEGHTEKLGDDGAVTARATSTTAAPACVRYSVRTRTARRKSYSAPAVEGAASSVGSSASIQFPPRYHRRAGRARRLTASGRKRPRKIVVIGDMCCGKSALISAYCKDKFSTGLYVPTILNSCLSDARIFGKRVDLAIVELSGRKDYCRLRQCAYKRTDAIIVCYATDNSESLENVLQYWLPEMQKYAPKSPCILVGTKNDIRDDRMYESERLTTASQEDGKKREALLHKLVSRSRVLEVGEAVGAHASMVCSALYRDRTRDVFEKAAEIALKKSRRKKKVQQSAGTCAIL